MNDNNKIDSTNKTGIKKIFNSLDKKHQIEITIIDEISWFNINKLDYEYCKTFLILLKDVILFLNQNNVRFIKQYIYGEDLEYFKKSSYINVDDNTYVVTSEIIHFLSELVSVLGINKL